MSLTRFAATSDEIRRALSSLAATTEFDLIPAPTDGHFTSTTLPRIEASSINDDMYLIYIVLKNAPPELEEITHRTEVKRRFPFFGSKSIQQKGYDLTYKARDSTVHLLIGGKRGENRLIESQVRLEDISRGEARLYRALAKRLTEGYELIEDMLFSPGAIELLSTGGLVICSSDPVGREAYNWEVIQEGRAVHEALKHSQTNSLLDIEASKAKLKQMGWIAEDDDRSVGESFDLFRTNAYRQDFSRLSLHKIYVGKSALEYVGFEESDLTQATFTTSDIVDCGFTGACLQHSEIAAFFVGCDFTKADFSNSDMSFSTFVNCNFAEANITGAVLSKRVHENLPLTDFQKDSATWVEPDPEYWGNV